MNDSSVHISGTFDLPLAELDFKTSRSGGPGGQNVNKLETRVELLFDVVHSSRIPEQLRERLLLNLSSSLDSSGVLHVVARDSRSQWKNKQLAIERFAAILKKALFIPKKRKQTRPTRTSAEKRIQAKKRRGEVKRGRRLHGTDE